MTRVLYWNVENFALNKIQAPPSRKRVRGGALSLADASADRLDYMFYHIQDANPEIFVLVELETSYGGVGTQRGQLVSNNDGRSGAYALLQELRLVAPDWMLVPPIITGPNESVAVYYRSTNLIFTGPNVWPGGAGGTSSRIPPRGDYPVDGVFDQMLPNPARLVPPAALQNQGFSERRCAARVDFLDTAPLHPAKNYGIQRAPYMVSFYNTALLQNITLFAIHSPATNHQARTYLQDLATVQEIVAANAANEIRVIVGDFNHNLLRNDLTPAQSYQHGALNTYGLGITANPAAPMAPVNGYSMAYGTHLKKRTKAGCWQSNAADAFYPGYGYFSKKNYAIDNILTRYGAGVAAPVPTNFTIFNGVVGAPYNTVVPPVPAIPGPPPFGTIAFANDLQANIPGFNQGIPLPLNGPPFVINLKTIFRSWVNFTHIRSTSDHLALAMDI